MTRTNVCDKLISDEGEVISMKEIFKSKVMICLILFIMGVFFVNNIGDARMQNDPSDKEIVYASK